MKKKITIELNLDIAIEIATYGESGVISRAVQLQFEKSIIEQGYKVELYNAKDMKLERLKENLSRVLGAQKMKQVEDAINTGVDAMRVANRLNRN